MGQTVTCTRAAALAPPATSAITLVVSVDAGAPSSVTNSVSVSTPGDADASNDSAPPTRRSPIGGPADLAHGGDPRRHVHRGSPEAYTLTVTNIGAAATTGIITVTDVLPAGLSFTSATGAGWSLQRGGTDRHLHQLRPARARRQQRRSRSTVSVRGAAVPSVTNTATVSTAGRSERQPTTAPATSPRSACHRSTWPSSATMRGLHRRGTRAATPSR